MTTWKRRGHPRVIEDLERACSPEICWERGASHSWECAAIVDADFLAVLIEVASHAPPRIRAALKDWISARTP
jgi:hypothetical protein